jgi:subtilisin family serine protease
LDRIDQTSLPLNNAYNYATTGKGVKVFIIDSGIRLSHDEFSGGRATCGFNAYQGTETCDDMCGHGTHVAGIAGGKTYGAAKGATLVAVKVLNNACGGSKAETIAGIDYVVGQKKLHPLTPMVINMSFEGPQYQPEIDAVKAAIRVGITSVAAAGNSAKDACLTSPASVVGAITVGATEISSSGKDNAVWFSNQGPCVDIFAPGYDILSAGIADNKASLILDGTSMAAPLVAGAAARYLQTSPRLTPAGVWRAIKAGSTLNVVQGITLTGTPNLLLGIR